MIGYDDRPEIRFAEISEDGAVDTTGQRSFGYFECVPSIGDVLVEPDDLTGDLNAVVVVGRQFIAPDSRERPPRWWIIVQPTDNSTWRDVCLLDDDTDAAFAEIGKEQYQEFAGRMHAEHVEKKRLRQVESAAQKARQPKGRQKKKPD